MELPIKYDPSLTEDKWYSYWLKHKFFHSEPDEREPYTIVIPPPNVTGVLHMGHMLNNTIQDVLVRRARMLGKNACWVPGTDHASIATEAKVVAKLKSEGIEKSDLTREQFLEHAWEWRHKHGGIILEQLKKLGASCDWDRTKFTMDPELSQAVIDTFVYFYKHGLIYRGVRMVNWDPEGLTAVSDEEVIHKETDSKFYHLKYPISDGNGNKTGEYVIIATTRPETIMADAAVCIHPEDDRYFHLKGKKVMIPLINKEIPIIEDDYVTIDFGTGCLKVTPAHDINDYEIGLRHNLPVIDIIDQHGKLNDKAQILVGEDRFVARKKIVKMLEEEGLLLKVEDYKSQVGYSERTNAVIEPRLSLQWFLKMDVLAKKALHYVENDDVKLIPDKFKNTYRHWMETAHDWCISRQLWWGQQIPAYYLPDGKVVVESSLEEAYKAAKEINPDIKIEDLRQDEDVLDTWFSSWLWPISLFDGINNPGNEEINYYYPTSDLVTGPDIIFFWVARMIMAGYEYLGDMPFKNVYFTGIVRDKIGRKMSKSLGNSPDPLDLIDRFGADGVRMGMMLSAPAGNDILFDDALCEQGRNFNNKIWNAFRLVKGWSVDEKIEQPESAKVATKWFSHQLRKTVAEINDDFEKYRISEALMAVYRLFWDEFSSWYLEMVKPAYQQPIDKATYEQTLEFFEVLLKLLHPFMPFITEELFQALKPRGEKESVMVSLQPKVEEYCEKCIQRMEVTKEIIAGVRNIRAEKGISPREAFELHFKGDLDEKNNAIIQKLANISAISQSDNAEQGASSSFMVGTVEISIPLGSNVNVEEEKKKMEAEIAYLEGFLNSVNKKLSNEKFVANAKPEIVENERKKKADAESKIATLKSNIEKLG